MGKAHRGRRLGESETAIQREALPNLLSPSHQANQIHQGRRNVECKRGSSLFHQTPPHESIRGSSQGVGNDAWVTMVRICLGGQLPLHRSRTKRPKRFFLLSPEGDYLHSGRRLVEVVNTNGSSRTMRPPATRPRSESPPTNSLASVGARFVMDRCAERIVSQFPVNCRNDDGKKSARRKGIHVDRVVGGDRHPWHFGRAAHTSGVVWEIQSARDYLYQQLQAARTGCRDVRR